MMVQDCPKQHLRVRRSIFHNIDIVFRLLDSANNKHQSQPIMTKTLAKRDYSWEYINAIIGWEVSTKLSTMNFPPHRVEILLGINPPPPPTTAKKKHIENMAKISVAGCLGLV